MKKEKNKICLLGASFNTNNMGVGALAAGVVKIIFHADRSTEIILLDYDDQSSIHHFTTNDISVPIRLINMRFSKKFYLSNNIAMLLLFAGVLKMIPFRSIRDSLVSTNPCLKHIAESDLILSIAGGDSFSDIYGIRNFLYVTLPQILVLKMGKNLILLPQTLGPYSRPMAKAVSAYILNHASAVFSRDYRSLEEIKTLPHLKYDPVRMNFCYDVGFILDPVKPAQINIAGPQTRGRDRSSVVGLNVSGLLYMGGYTRDNMFELRVDYRKLVVEIIDYLIKQKKASVMLVPHVFGSAEHTESDSVACEKIYKENRSRHEDNLSMISGKYNQNEIKYIIGLCDFFIGSRMHACIAALSQNIPTVPIAYSKKFIGVMETIGVDSNVADPRVLSNDEIIKVIDETFEKREMLRKHLEETIPHVKDTVLNLLNLIKNLSHNNKYKNPNM